MKETQAARRYAEALFEIARSQHRDREYEAELFAFRKMLRDEPDLARFFESPRFTSAEKKKFLERVYHRAEPVQRTLLGFFKVLLEKGRFGLAGEIADRYKEIADHSQGEGFADVLSTVELRPEEEAKIKAVLERLAGYKLTIRKKIEPALVGGVQVRVDQKILDGSIRKKMKDLARTLTERKNF